MAALCAFVGTAWASSSAPIVTTSLGQVSGKVDSDVNCYQGIPFAQPPVGDLRFLPPQPASPWSGVLDGTKTPPICVQTGILSKKVTGFVCIACAARCPIV